MSNSNIAYVIKIGVRYFCGFGKKGQVMTAWCLAGAKFFMEKPTLVLEKLDEKGKSYQVVSVGDASAFEPAAPVECKECKEVNEYLEMLGEVDLPF